MRIKAKLLRAEETVDTVAVEAPGDPAFFTQTRVSVPSQNGTGNVALVTEILGDLDASTDGLVLHQELIDAYGRVLADFGSVAIERVSSERKFEWCASPWAAGRCAKSKARCWSLAFPSGLTGLKLVHYDMVGRKSNRPVPRRRVRFAPASEG